MFLVYIKWIFNSLNHQVFLSTCICVHLCNSDQKFVVFCQQRFKPVLGGLLHEGYVFVLLQFFQLKDLLKKNQLKVTVLKCLFVIAVLNNTKNSISVQSIIPVINVILSLSFTYTAEFALQLLQFLIHQINFLLALFRTKPVKQIKLIFIFDICFVFAHPVGVDFFQVFQLIHVKTILEVSHYFGKIYLLNCLVGCLILKRCPDIRVRLFI